MLRRTLATLRVSPFSIFLRDLARKKELQGVPLGEGTRVASRLYRALPPGKMRALRTRATKAKYPALDAFNRFQRQHAYRFTHLNNRQRQRVIGKMWHEMKLKKSQEKLRAKKAAKASKKNAVVKMKKKRSTAKAANKKGTIAKVLKGKLKLRNSLKTKSARTTIKREKHYAKIKTRLQRKRVGTKSKKV